MLTKKKLPNREAGGDCPVTLTLPDGRVIAVAVPAKFTGHDRDGSIVLLPPALRMLDRLQALFTPVPAKPTPGFIIALREALHLTVAGLAKQLHVEATLVASWQKGSAVPDPAARRALEKLRADATRRGLAVAA